MGADIGELDTGTSLRAPLEESRRVGSGDEPDRPMAGRITERDLLWVESVSERLLGSSDSGRAWERVYFSDDDDTPDDALDQARQDTAEDAANAAGPPAGAARDERAREDRPDETTDQRGIPASPEPAAAPARSLSEADADWALDPVPGHIDLTSAPAVAMPIRPEDLEDEVLRMVLATGDATLAAVVMQLLGERSRDQARIGTLETALRAVLDQVGDRLPALAPLRRVLDH